MGNVLKKSALKKIYLLHFSVDELFTTVQIGLHDRKIIFCGPRRKQ